MKPTRTMAVLLVGLLPLSAVGACASKGEAGANGGSQNVTIEYALWDSLQQPAYEQCATDFTQANPGITVKFSQAGWNDYWTNLTTNMVSGTAPDVFTNHVTWFPQLADQGQVLDIKDKVAADSVDTSLYQERLLDVWHGQHDELWGLPKDWDTVALTYNVEKAKEAGYQAKDLQDLTWNPADGGTFGEFIARMTVDKNGRRGDEPGFDKTKVATYGFGLQSSGGSFGQTEWSIFVLTTGWQYMDKNPWGTKFNFSDPRFKDTIGWIRAQIEKGYIPSLDIIDSAGGSMLDPFGAGKYASVMDGDWNANAYHSLEGIKVGFAPTPIGPDGKRATPFNGLADSIWSGSKHKDEAWKWVKYLGSPACQNVVAEHAVVFPAIKESTDKAATAFKAKGMDMSAFLMQVEDGTTFLPPIAEHWADVQTTMTAATDAILSLQKDVDSLDRANEEVNALFK